MNKISFEVRHIKSVPINYLQSLNVLITENKKNVAKFLKSKENRDKFFLITIKKDGIPIDVCNTKNFFNEFAKF